MQLPRAERLRGRQQRLVARAPRLAAAALCGAILAWSAYTPATAAATAATPLRLLPLNWSTSRIVAPVELLPAGSVALGAPPSSQQIVVDVVLAPRHPRSLARLASAVSTPGSPLRGSYLTPRQLRDEFSPSAAEVSQVEVWLRDLGLDPVAGSTDRLTVTVKATAASFARALATRFEQYRLPGGKLVYANTTGARLPMPLAGDVATVVGLNDLPAARPLLARLPGTQHPRVAQRTSSAPVASTAATSAPKPCAAALAQRAIGGRTASQLAGYYGMSGLYAKGDLGSGITIGIVEFERVSSSDLATYESCYGISTSVRYIAVDGGARGVSYGSGEAALDIEDVAGLAPQARLLVYQAPNSNRGVLDEFQRIVEHPTADVVTNSWGECEQALGSTAAAAKRAAQAESTLFEYAAAEGQSWLSAAGDYGSTDCWGEGSSLPFTTQQSLAVDDPGSQPYMTSVGGTTLHAKIHRETVWNVGGAASGGGISSIWPMPAYQLAASPGLGVVNAHSSPHPCGVAVGYCREVPDVTADANPATGYIIYYDGAWTTIGGTSGAAPLWAAVTALVDASPRCGGRSVGFLNPTLYALAGSRRYPAVLTDIRAGGNDDAVSGYTGGLYRAAKGYDMASGLGSPIVTSQYGGLASAMCELAHRLRPGINSIKPDTGPKSGGNSVKVYGYGFSGVQGVEFGSVRAHFHVGQDWTGSPTWITVIVPPGAGTVHVRVLTTHGTSANSVADTYTYEG